VCVCACVFCCAGVQLGNKRYSRKGISIFQTPKSLCVADMLLATNSVREIENEI
jgi:hypothetical protein